MFPLLFLPFTFLTVFLFLKLTSPREEMVWVRRKMSVKEPTEEPEGGSQERNTVERIGQMCELFLNQP